MSYIMLRKRSLVKVLCQVNKKASEKDKSIINSERATKNLQSEVNQRYLNILALWDKYIQ
jgi:hypothetical protein